jgi:hypothetical protein
MSCLFVGTYYVTNSLRKTMLKQRLTRLDCCLHFLINCSYYFKYRVELAYNVMKGTEYFVSL